MAGKYLLDAPSDFRDWRAYPICTCSANRHGGVVIRSCLCKPFPPRLGCPLFQESPQFVNVRRRGFNSIQRFVEDIGTCISLLTPWRNPQDTIPFIEYDGNRNELRPSNCLSVIEGRTCIHYPMNSIGDPFWTPGRDPK